MWRGRAAGADPWGGDTLEWATASPPAHYNFLRLPVVSGREPLWHEPERAPVVTGLATDKREVLITHVFDAAPDHRYIYPSPSPWPFVAALVTGAMLIGGLFTPWSFAIGLTVLAIFLTVWFWPSSPQKEGKEPASSASSREAA